jgi:tetratricopeptide (TPR) repeat protein
MKIMLVILLIIVTVSGALAADNQSIWKDAANQYDQGQYKTAIATYNKLLERGMKSPQLYYNLGISYFKDSQLGYAIWAFKRALTLDPGFKQAKTNLEYVRTFNTDQIALERRGFILDIWNLLSGLLSANGYLLLFMLGWWSLTILIILGIVRLNGNNWIYYLLILPVVIIIFSGAAAAMRINEDRLTHWGVLSRDSADIREGPGADFNKIEVGHEGLEFKILGARENSYLIELGNGLKGWVDKQAVLEI